jgi:hypothetical protein
MAKTRSLADLVRWNVAEINEATIGAVVHEALDAITDTDWQQSRGGGADQEQLVAFRIVAR